MNLEYEIVIKRKSVYLINELLNTLILNGHLVPFSVAMCAYKILTTQLQGRNNEDTLKLVLQVELLAADCICLDRLMCK